jgi:hypothetical protein
MDNLQDGMWINSTAAYEEYDRKQAEYTSKMNKLYNRLHRYYNFDKEKFYALQDQAVMF